MRKISAASLLDLSRAGRWLVAGAGVLLILVAEIALDPKAVVPLLGGLICLALGLLLGALAFSATAWGRLGWLAPPAAVLMILGLLLIRGQLALFRLVWPVALALTALYLLVCLLRWVQRRPALRDAAITDESEQATVSPDGGEQRI